MDRAELSEAMIAELGDVFVRELRRAGPALVAGDLDGIERGLQDLGRRVLGRVVEGVVAAVAAAEPAEPPACAGCRRAMRPVDRARQRALQGLVGDYTLRRAYYHCGGCGEGAAPLDERLGLGPGVLSPGLSRAACRVGIEEAFERAADVVREVLRIDLAAETTRRATEGIGAVAEAEQQAAMGGVLAGRYPPAAGEPPPATLLLAVDGVMVPIDKDWKEAKVGVVAPLGPGTRSARDGPRARACLAPGRQTYCAGFEPAAGFWARAYAELCRRGLGAPGLSLLVVLGDGADWIWHYARQFLRLRGLEVVEIVDIYHAWEHLWQVANAVFGAGSPAAAAWVEPLKWRLEEAGAGPIIAALDALAAGATTEAAADEVRKARGYFAEHAARMDYPRFVARRLPIGSGIVESACKTLIQAREKQAGMRWGPTGAQAVATLRALHRSGRWDRFWQTRPQRRRPPARRSPPSAIRTHDPAAHAA
jgi:hypothetical protein